MVQAQVHAKLLLDVCDLEDLGHVAGAVRAMSKDCSSWSVLDRLHAVNAASGFSYLQRSLLLEYTGPLSDDILQVALPDGTKLLHSLADEVGRRSKSPPKIPAGLERGLRSSGTCHTKNNAGLTPFLTLLEASVGRDRINTNVSWWVQLAYDVGVDLCSYGEWELRAWRDLLHISQSGASAHRDIVSFTIGPEPSHWQVWYRHEGDGFAGTFWRLVESERQRTPGAWDDDEDHDLILDPESDELGLHRARCCVGVKRKTVRRLKKELQMNTGAGKASHRSALILRLFDLVMKSAEVCKSDRSEGRPIDRWRVQYATFSHLRLGLDIPRNSKDIDPWWSVEW